MKFFSFIRSPESLRNSPPPPEMMAAMDAFVKKSLADGTVIDTGGRLMPSQDGFRLRLAGGELTLTDGPFSESKEVIGGYAILQADSKEEAVRISREFMELHRKHWPEFEGEAEVRAMFDPGVGR